MIMDESYYVQVQARTLTHSCKLDKAKRAYHFQAEGYKHSLKSYGFFHTRRGG
jgi:hypothetical protein